MSFSGREVNKLFLQQGDGGFPEVAYLFGVDSVQDGRVATLADLDRDGAEELIVVSRNAPVLRIFSRRASGGVLALAGLRVGARVTVRCSDRTIRRDVFGGVGFGTQTSRVVTIPTGCERIEDVRVDGRSLGALEFGYYVVSSAGVARDERFFRTPAPVKPPKKSALASLLGLEGATYVALWASWCRSCQRTQGALDALSKNSAVPFVGVSIDPADAGVEHAAAYPSVEPADHAAVLEALRGIFGEVPPLPAGVLVDAEGVVRWHGVGVPAVSDLRLVSTEPTTTIWPWIFGPLGVLLVVVLVSLRRRAS